MFKKILIANRGEIALRIIRACHELGIQTVAVYSEADEDSLHVKFSDEAICIGPPPGLQSYLLIPQILASAEITNSDAIHPGYGFLSENANFADCVAESNITFIGPPGKVISELGDKALAKETMKKAGVPVIPGSVGVIESAEEARKIAKEIGYPVILKATAGGGGKGMRIVRSEEEIENALSTASLEAQASFDNGSLYMEKFIEKPRHIEIQLLADMHGNVIHLGERECSIQRRHQKLIEESPSPAVSPELRKQMGDAAIKGAREANYLNAGTMEFLLDKDENFYFMEMNTRIQVEHPVTEMVYGVDLLKEQILIAAGEPISHEVMNAEAQWHAIECRINAEDPEHDFMPSPSLITAFHVPGGVGIRVDTHVYAGYEIPQYYDSLLAKMISWGRTREEAIGRMKRGIEECVIEGPKTTLPFHLQVLKHHDFASGNYDTSFLESFEFDPSLKSRSDYGGRIGLQPAETEKEKIDEPTG